MDHGRHRCNTVDVDMDMIGGRDDAGWWTWQQYAEQSVVYNETRAYWSLQDMSDAHIGPYYYLCE